MTDAPDIPELDPNHRQDVLEDAGVAFNPGAQHLDLTKDEKRRTTALLMAVQAYDKLIIKEADYLVAAADLARRNEGPALRPATIDAMVEAAFKFDCFISGVPRDDMPKGDQGFGRPAAVEEGAEPEPESRSQRRRKKDKP